MLRSEEGDMMGDPFEGIAIESGILKIHHFGGSSWKWRETHKYRFQNGDFFLIGRTSVYGKPCEYFTKSDFNLSTGRVSYEKQYEECDGDGEQVSSNVEKEAFTHKLAKLPTLGNVTFGKHKLVSPQLKAEIYY